MLGPANPSQTYEYGLLVEGRDVKIYRLRDGKTLIGQTLWLQAEEMNDGSRIFNKRFS